MSENGTMRIMIYLETLPDILKYLVDDRDHEFGVVSLKIVGKHRK